MSRNNYVVAHFDGAERRFEIPREAMNALDNALPGGAFATLKRFHAGYWTADDVTTVLAFGLHELMPSERLCLEMEARIGVFTNRPAGGGIKPSIAQVRRCLLADGHGAYSGLAELVLRAAVLGIEDGEVVYDPDAE